MKNLTLGLAFALLSTTAFAVDIRTGHIMPKAPQGTFTWDGAYIGINFGAGLGDNGITNSQSVTGGLAGLIGSVPGDDNSRPRGFVLGGQAGYNKQLGGVVLGLELDFDWSTIKSSGVASAAQPLLASSASSSYSQNLKWLGLAQARVGAALGHWMPYVIGGLAVGKVETNIASTVNTFGLGCIVGCGSVSDGATKIGWTVGGGVEVALNRNLSFKTQYNYVDLGHVSGAYAGTGTTLGPGTTASSYSYGGEYKYHIIKAGANYRF